MLLPDEPLDWLGDAAGRLRTIAEISGTVDLERALVEFGSDPALAAAALPDPLLGARIVVVQRGDRESMIALAEPSTEGRLAATLARHGEGPAGRYIWAPVGLDEIGRLASAAGIAVSRRASGPFGPEVLVRGGALGSRSWIFVEAAAVPSLP